jgi:hypothetical protein
MFLKGTSPCEELQISILRVGRNFRLDLKVAGYSSSVLNQATGKRKKIDS